MLRFNLRVHWMLESMFPFCHMQKRCCPVFGSEVENRPESFSDTWNNYFYGAERIRSRHPASYRRSIQKLASVRNLCACRMDRSHVCKGSSGAKQRAEMVLERHAHSCLLPLCRGKGSLLSGGATGNILASEQKNHHGRRKPLGKTIGTICNKRNLWMEAKLLSKWNHKPAKTVL